jgi:hypothetical protein
VFGIGAPGAGVTGFGIVVCGAVGNGNGGSVGGSWRASALADAAATTRPVNALRRDMG